ncbi:MAG: ATP-grasp domain-containing protein [bacterium]|nr:ATP-grasp domain-containing protein [bacterium]
MKIIVLYNLVKTVAVGMSEDILADEDTVKTAKAIAENLTTDHDVSLFEVGEENTGDLKKLKPDLFFNNAFGIGSVPKSEVDLANILEDTKIPFTGSPARAIALTTDKVLTKNILMAKNLPTPKFQVFTNGEIPDKKLRFPLIVKPIAEDCSLGISDSSVVSDEKDLMIQVHKLRETYSEAVMVEEFIEGRELNITVLGNGIHAVALPVSEIIFGKKYPGKYKIVDFNAKWEEATDNYKETNGVCPAELTPEVLENINKISNEAYQLTGCRDFARVDIRLSKDNTPYILEVNANPGIGPNDGAARSARAAGYSYSQFLQKIINVALERK